MPCVDLVLLVKEGVVVTAADAADDDRANERNVPINNAYTIVITIVLIYMLDSILSKIILNID
jgi:hypothetical protein